MKILDFIGIKRFFVNKNNYYNYNMEKLTIILIIIVILCIINKLFHNSYFQELNPIGSHKIWMYCPKNGSYFEKLMKKHLSMNVNGLINDLIILTSDNIDKYLTNFPINMKDESIPLEKRINLLYSFILYEYGGLCISPGTIPISINSILNRVYIYEIVTVGGNPQYSQLVENNEYPNTKIIGSKKESEYIKIYRNKLLENIGNNQLKSYNILSEIIREYKPKQYHFSSLTDGTMDIYKKPVILDDYLNVNGPQLDEDKLVVISLPYDELYQNRKYEWFLNLDEKQFEESEFFIKKFL